MSLKKIISRFSRKKILVVGDLILDRYIQGSVSRISPEAPVPVVLESESFCSLGGASSVANNLAALGAQVTLVGRVGDDREGQEFKKISKQNGISIKGVFADKKIPTILKTRVLAQRQQIVRVDREKLDYIGVLSSTLKIVNFIKRNFDSFDGVIISDYGKGVITQELIDCICFLAKKNKTIITVDPKVEHFSYYRHLTAITPNLKEAENAIRNIKVTSKSAVELGVHTDKLMTDEDIDSAGTALLDFLDMDSILITLGDRGMRLFERLKKPYSIKTQAKEVFDVSGAGDTVISTFTLALTANATKRQAADLANSAAGIAVGKMGAVAVSKKELLGVIA